MLECPWPCSSLVLYSGIDNVWINNRNASILVSCMSTNKPPFVFCQVLCRVNAQNSQQKHTTKSFARFPNRFPPLTMVRIIKLSRTSDVKPVFEILVQSFFQLSNFPFVINLYTRQYYSLLLRLVYFFAIFKTWCSSVLPMRTGS